jgi:hypothetical protein
MADFSISGDELKSAQLQTQIMMIIDAINWILDMALYLSSI